MKMEDMSEEKLFHYGKVKNYKFIIFIVYWYFFYIIFTGTDLVLHHEHVWNC
jgi:hypothetical protein